MKSTYCIIWYFFIIYATSVVVNFSHYHKTLANDANESMIINAAKCILQDRNTLNDDPNACKFSFQYKKETVLYFLKNLLNRKEFSKAYKLTLKNGSKNGSKKKEIDLINITLDLKPLFNEKATNSTTFNWYPFYLFISIVLIIFTAPLWPLTNYIYLITLLSMFILSFTVYLNLVKLIVFSIVYLVTFKKYKLWLLPNLSKDVGLLGTFWPVFELNKNVDLQIDNSTSRNRIDNLSSLNCVDKPKNEKESISLETNYNSSINGKLSQLDNEASQNKIDRTSSNERSKNTNSANHNLNAKSTTELKTKPASESKTESTSNQTITEFTGNDHLPSITRTPPTISGFKSFERYANNSLFDNKLEIIDLSTGSSECDDEVIEDDKKLTSLESDNCEISKSSSNGSVDKFASITPVVSYLNVNDVKKNGSLARKRIPSNRSDDGFEILNNDFLHSPTPKATNGFFSSKQDL